MDMQQKSGWKVRINLYNKAKILNLNYSFFITILLHPYPISYQEMQMLSNRS